MKYSIYNNIVTISPKIILLFNSFSDSYMFLSASVSNLLKTPSLVKEKHLKLYRNMVKKGFYVSENIDEFERLKSCTEKILNDKRSFFLIINPTMDCNLRCWYCYEKHEKSEMNKDVFQNVLSFIKDKIASGIKVFCLGFFGGEPLMKFSSIVMPLIEHTYQLCKQENIEFRVSFTSNGTLLTKSKIEELCRFCKPSFQITLDGNEEIHNKVRFLANRKGTYSLILQNIKVLLEYNCPVRVRINHTKDSIKSIHDILQKASVIFNEHKELIEFDFHRVWQDRDTEERVLPEVKAYAGNLIEKGFNALYDELNEIRNPCYGDKANTAVINYNGDVFKCTAKDFCKENREGFLTNGGKMIWEKSQEYRLSVKLKNTACKKCSIAPICGGGCSRYILEKEEKPYCLFNYDNKAIEKFILNHVEKMIMRGHVNK